ncbi:MAG: DUF4058 family protein [Caldilineaceae bacterium]
MPSPFPGMDPYIEDPEIWSDFHLDLAAEIRTRLNQVIQPSYVARLIPRVTYELVEIGKTHRVHPDIGVWQTQHSPKPHPETAVLIPPAPNVSTVKLEVPFRLASVEVRKTGTLELVTAIEILSPVNKQPSHDTYSEYQRKRRELLRSATHLMEIDLLRGGQRPPLEEPVPQAPYYVTLSRADRRPVVEVWPIKLQERLPVLPVPLLEPDPDVALDLAAVVADIYERGGYASLIDYHRPPPPPKLAEADLLWLDELLREQEVR